ncbi:BspC domain-containing protein [Paraburkholderia phosphatilytica]|uniref:BspC domain-containing protein n=1 Tax=Paraburkholderia phosphatilytica TaxID=2282883 RepID=UPI000E525779|nr:hypothetical protein [Paraburkholderia phosphatilytica]
MDRTTVPRRLLRLVGRVMVVVSGVSLALSVPAFADQLEQHNELVNKFITDMHADPLVADCAAHADFVVSTSTAFDHVDFPPSSFDSSHATVTPWNDSFDEGKQRVKVDNIVTIEGLGIRTNNVGDPMDLKFRCGYLGNQMLAFSWNDPVPMAKPRSELGGSRHSAKGHHVAKKSTGKAAKGKATGSKSSASKSTKSKKKTTH